MRSSLAGILIFAVLVMNFQTLGTYAWFLYNQDFIAEFLCINKDKPAMHCDGKCVLMARLAKEDPVNNQNTQIPGSDERPIFLIYNSYEAKDDSAVDGSYRHDIPTLDVRFHSGDFCLGLFRPPRC